MKLLELKLVIGIIVIISLVIVLVDGVFAYSAPTPNNPVWSFIHNLFF